jgi:protein phosphatase
MRDLLWSDPTENDTVEGIRANARGDEMVEFGPDRVKQFLEENNLDLIVRAHQCVPGGYEFFASQHLVTIFSATNYCGRHDNDGAILTVTRDLTVLFHVITFQERRPFSLWSNPHNSTPPRTRKVFFNP